MIININDIIPTKSLNNKDKKIDYLLEKSIKKYGQLYPILINKKNEIIKGNSTFLVLKKLNIENVFVKIIDCENDKQLYLELKFIKNEINPIECFEYFKHIDINNNCLPFSKKQIQDFIKLLNFNWKQYKIQQSNLNDIF